MRWGASAVPMNGTGTGGTVTLLGVAMLALAALGGPAPALAQPRGAGRAADAPEDLLPLSDFEDDPIGVGHTRAPLQSQPSRPEKPSPAANATAAFGPEPPEGRVTPGPALVSAPGVRETRHQVSVRLARQVAEVTIEQHFAHRLDKPAEVSRRLPVPPGTRIADFEVCHDRRCRRGQVAPAPTGDDSDGVDAYDAAVMSRPASPGRKAPPVGRARLRPPSFSTDRSTPTLQLDLAPVTQDQPILARVTLHVPVRQDGGVVRLRWPGEAMDPSTTSRELTVTAQGLHDVRPETAEQGALRQDPWLAQTIEAKVPPGAAVRGRTTLFPCDRHRGRCARLQLDVGPAPLEPRDVIVAIDASPSMQGPARSRLPAALSALLAATPQGSRVRALRFAGRADGLLTAPKPPATLSLEPFRPALQEAELGSATRLETAVDLAARWFRRDAKRGLPKLLLVLGDGGVTLGQQAHEAVPGQRAKRASQRIKGAPFELSVVNLADRDTHPALMAAVTRSGGTVVDAGAAAERAMRGAHPGHLEAKLQALFAPRVTGALSLPDALATGRGPRVLPALRAGAQIDWEGPVRGTRLRVEGLGRATAQGRAPSPGAESTWLAVPRQDLKHPQDDWPAAPRQVKLRRDGKPPACDRRGPPQRLGGQSRDDAPVRLAFARRCRVPPKQAPKKLAEGEGMPSSPLLQMLRERIIPVARGCLRRDRAGRADYAVRAVYRFTLAEQEVVRARVEGNIAPPLRRCLRDAVDSLLVPRFTGTVHVSYPIRTLRETLPSQIELSAGTAQELERVLTIPD